MHHLDVRYIAIAPPAACEVTSDESLDVRWWPVDALPPESDTVPTMVALTRT